MTQKKPQFILVNFPISKYKSVDFEKCKEDFENEEEEEEEDKEKEEKKQQKNTILKPLMIFALH